MGLTPAVAGAARPTHPTIAALAAEVGPPTAGPVVAAGGGTRPATLGGAVAPGARAVAAPSGIVEHLPAEGIVRVLAGTPVEALDAALAPSGQCVALPARPGSTVGGTLAVADSDLRRLRWGPVRDALLEVTVVTADGTVATAGGPTVKNVSGYDLCRLLVGSLGTLAVLGEVVLRTRPRPAAERWLAGAVDPAVLDAHLFRPAAILWDRTTSWVLLSGHPADVDAQAAVAGALGCEPVECEPPLPPHRWSVDPAGLAGLGGTGWVAEWGVGTVHHPEPPPAQPVPRPIAALHRRVKEAFDPTGRLAPGRSALGGAP